MPPLGTGFPVNFVVVGAEDFQPMGSNLRGGAFALTGVDPGEWYLLAVMDRNRDLHPGVLALTTASCGDYFGGYTTDLDRDEFATVTVEEGGFVDGVVIPVVDELTHAAPVFTVDGDPTVGADETFRLISVGVTGSFGPTLSIDVPAPSPAAEPCESAFHFVRADEDEDGQADTSDLLPLLEERWPRVVMQLARRAGRHRWRRYDRRLRRERRARRRLPTPPSATLCPQTWSFRSRACRCGPWPWTWSSPGSGNERIPMGAPTCSAPPTSPPELGRWR